MLLVGVFLAFLLFGLKQNPNFNPSQLYGKKSPDFQAKVTDGHVLFFHQLAQDGRWKILNFWSSGCSICRNEAPELENFYKNVSLKSNKYPEFISINIQDNETTIREWQSHYQLTFPVLEDTNGFVSLQFGVTGTPETFLIDPAGIVRYRIAGEIETKTILHFISWLDSHQQAKQNDALRAYETLSKSQL